MGKSPLLWMGPVLLLLAAAGAFLPCLWGDFVYDDWRFIVHNRFMQAPVDPVWVFTDSNTLDDLSEQDIYRPIRTLLFQIEYKLGQGKPFLHHLVSLFFHLANTLLLFTWLRRVPHTDASAHRDLSGAFFGAAIFALHPIQAESVAWISSRSDLLVTFFLLLLLNHQFKRRARFSWPDGLITAGLTLLACFSKESGVLACGLILLCGLCLPGHRRAITLFHAAAALIAAVVYLWIRSRVIGGLEGQVPPHGGGFGSNLVYAFYGLMHQVLLLFQGGRLSVEYPEPSGSVFSLQILIPALGFVVLAAGCAIGLLLFKARRALLGVLIFLVSLFPTSSLIFPMTSLYNDRYLYLPMLGIAMIASTVFSALKSRLMKIRGLPEIGFVILAAVLASLTWNRCHEWRDGETLWKATLQRNSVSIKARIGLSRICFNEGRTAEASKWAFEAVDRSKPGSAVRSDALHLAASALNRQGDKEQAAACLRRALTEAKTSTEASTFKHRMIEIAQNLWALEMETGRYEGALEAAKKLIEYEGETPQNLLMKVQATQAMD